MSDVRTLPHAPSWSCSPGSSLGVKFWSSSSPRHSLSGIALRTGHSGDGSLEKRGRPGLPKSLRELIREWRTRIRRGFLSWWRSTPTRPSYGRSTAARASSIRPKPRSGHLHRARDRSVLISAGDRARSLIGIVYNGYFRRPRISTQGVIWEPLLIPLPMPKPPPAQR